MAYYGGGATPHMHPGAQGPVNHQMYGNQGPHSSQQAAMYQQEDPAQGHFIDYNNSNVQQSYGQQGYYEYQQQMYDPGLGQSGPPVSGMEVVADPRSHMMQPSNPSQYGRGEPTKILRNPFPEVSKEINQKNKDIYDPNFPTGPPTSGQTSGGGHYNQQRMAPPPPIISAGGQAAVSMASSSGGTSASAPMYGSGSTVPATDNRSAGMGNTDIYSNSMYRNNTPHSQTQPTNVLPANYQLPFQEVPYGNASNNTQQEPQKSKMQVMTGIVTQVQPGAFGMVSEEIFFQEHVVSGPIPKLGDKVVVEAEAVIGMPFKFNAKRVTKLDMDLEEKNTTPTPPTFQQNPHQQAQSFPQHYSQPPFQQQYQNSESSQHFQSGRRMMEDSTNKFEPPNFGPLPSLPESLNLPRPVPPPNLASVIPSSANSNHPLKSILKRKGSPSASMKRNPPPPPVISKNASKESTNLFRSSAPSSLKQKFEVDLNKDIPRVLPPQGNGPLIEFPEYTFFNKERPKFRKAPTPDIPAATSPRITRLLPKSPIPDFGNRRSDSVDELQDSRRQRSRSRDRTPPRRYRSRSKSPRDYSSRRSQSRSVSPRRPRRSRSSTISPSPRRSRRSRSGSVSPSRRGRSPCRKSRYRRSRSRSFSPKSRHRRSRSRSISPKSRHRRSRSRSISPKGRRRTSRSTSRDAKADSRRRRSHRSRRSSRSRSRSESRSPYRTRFSPVESKRSISPPHSTGVKVLEETITHGIVVKRVSSDLFPKFVSKPKVIRESDIIRRDGKPDPAPVKKTATPPVPIKFQIANPAKPPPTPASSMVPNPTFKAVPTMYLQNPAFNITKTVVNPDADAKGKKKKSKDQEPAFRIIDDNKEQPKGPAAKTFAVDKIKQWEEERQALKSKIVKDITSAADNLLKNPINVLQLKQTIQNDLQELRSKGLNEPGKKLLENPVDIQKLKQTVQRDLHELKSKDNITGSTLPATKEKTTQDAANNPVVINKSFDDNVEQRLKELRSKFENHIKDTKNSTDVQKKPEKSATTEAPKLNNTITELQKDTLLVEKEKSKAPVPRFPSKQPSSAGRSKGPPLRHESPPIEVPPYDEQMERLQEEIHQQRYMEEERRLKFNRDEPGLHQLYYMEDRRRRRMDERRLSYIRMTEIKLKKEKQFGQLARLREEWGPPAQRLEQERELRQIRMDEESHENQLNGQAEAIRRQEFEYQKWLEEEAAARSRNFQDVARASRGCEGRVLRRRTPSPSSRRGPPSIHQGSESRATHPHSRRSRSSSFERYKEGWHRRHPRDRSPPMSYEQFVMRYPLEPPSHPFHSMPPDRFPPNHPDFHGPMPPHHLEEDGFMISRAMDDVTRRQDELMHREMEIQRRMEMAQRRFDDGPPPSHPSHRDSREEIRRFVVPRR